MDASLHFHHFLNQSKQKQKQQQDEDEKRREKFVAYAASRYLREVPGVIIGYNYERERRRGRGRGRGKERGSVSERAIGSHS